MTDTKITDADKMNAALKRMLNTPPKPRKPAGDSGKKERTKNQSTIKSGEKQK